MLYAGAPLPSGELYCSQSHSLGTKDPLAAKGKNIVARVVGARNNALVKKLKKENAVAATSAAFSETPRDSNGGWSFGDQSGAAADIMALVKQAKMVYGSVQLLLNRRLLGHTDASFVAKVHALSHPMDRVRDMRDPHARSIIYYCQTQAQTAEAEARNEMSRQRDKNMMALFDALKAAKSALGIGSWEHPLLSVSVYSVECGARGASLQELDGIQTFMSSASVNMQGCWFLHPAASDAEKEDFVELQALNDKKYAGNGLNACVMALGVCSEVAYHLCQQSADQNYPWTSKLDSLHCPSWPLTFDDMKLELDLYGAVDRPEESPASAMELLEEENEQLRLQLWQHEEQPVVFGGQPAVGGQPFFSDAGFSGAGFSFFDAGSSDVGFSGGFGGGASGHSGGDMSGGAGYSGGGSDGEQPFFPPAASIVRHWR